jgi:hypothetical protein
METVGWLSEPGFLGFRDNHDFVFNQENPANQVNHGSDILVDNHDFVFNQENPANQVNHGSDILFELRNA